MMDVKRLIVFGGVLAVVIVGMTFLGSKPELKESNTSSKVIAVSTFSLLEAARSVAGDAMEIRSIVPVGNDPHMFSPNPSQVAELSRSALFIYNGAGFESWAEKLTNTLPKTTRVIDMSHHVKLHENGKGHHKEDEHDHDADEEHHHGEYDPHYWLDIDNMIKMTQTLEKEFSTLIPSKAEYFHQNAAGYIAELEKLKGEFASGLLECKKRTLVSNHDAFGYLARANKLENISVIGLSSDEQPSAKTMTHVVEVVKEHGVKAIFFEALVNDNVSQTIAKETGVKVLSLQPLENISQDELKSHQTYLSIMRENLKKLREAMECR